MFTKETTGIVLIFLATVTLGWLLGKYISRWLKDDNRKHWMQPVETLIYKWSGIDPKVEMTWQQHMKALLTVNLVWFVYGFAALVTQGSLPLNPDGNPSMTADLAFNTAISFIVNCNLQHYAGETGVTYFTQVFVIAFFQFVSAATGIASAFILFKALRHKTTTALGNFWVYFTRSVTRILLPFSLVLAVFFAARGIPASWDGKDTIITLQGDTVQVSRGPAAGMVAIKHLGTNGGGFFGANSSHPFENPDALTNAVQLIAQCVIPIALVFALGFYLERRKLAWVIFTVMTIGFLCLLVPALHSEVNGNPAIRAMGINQPTGAMEGKETRFGPANTAYWSIVTTIISTGSVNGMLDSTMPMSGAMQMLGMMTNAFYGGCGVGLLNYFIFLIIAVFVSGMMVGRTPEFLGKKIEAREMKIASLVAILHPLLILAFTALSSYLIAHHPQLPWTVPPASWLNNPGSHGFSEMLYEYTSSAANNGSGFEGLGDNNIFWNLSCGVVLLLGRYLPIIGPVAIAGSLAAKKYIPETAGTLRSDSFTFGLVTFAVIVIIAALSFFPALTLGPLAEYFTLPHP